MNTELIYLLESLKVAIANSTKSVKICVPNTDYYARDTDWSDDRIDIIDSDTLQNEIDKMIILIKK